MAIERTVIVLAAGEGKRMKSAMPKVLHPLLGRTLLGHVLATTQVLRAQRCVVVVGHGAEQVSAHVAAVAPHAVTALQAQQRGTGHAARIGLDAAEARSGTVVIVNGDVPLLRPQTLAALVASHEQSGAAATVLTAELDNPAGLGRIVRDASTGTIDTIVEERDATSEQKVIREINAGLYAFDAALLGPALGKLTTHNDQGEEYLTDVIEFFADSGHTVNAFVAADATEVGGCNDRVELAALGAQLRDRVNGEWMRSGVTIVDPQTTWIDVTATVGPDTVIEPHTQLRGTTEVGSAVVLGPDTTLVDTVVGEGAEVVRSHAVRARIGPKAHVGPFAYLRPDAVLGETSKVGAFVEVKNSELGAGAKVPHLSYVGDATVGPAANIGAGTIVVNYDGVRKHHTTIGEAAFIGCDTSLIAPVEIGPGAYIAAGSVINQYVAPGALAVTRPPQREIKGWVQRRRPGTRSAQAARAAEAANAAGAAEVGNAAGAAGVGNAAGAAERANVAQSAESWPQETVEQAKGDTGR